MSLSRPVALFLALLVCTVPVVAQTPAATVTAVAPASLAPLPKFLPKIDRRPAAEGFGRGLMYRLPTYDPKSTGGWQVDLRSYDLSKLDLRKSAADLAFADFDTLTKWPTPDKMPRDFDWKEILETGKNPGLGVRTLHAKGITGRGVGIAIIDQPLIVDHVEYAGQIRLYEEINTGAMASQMHGPAVASIAVGKSIGVAPEADLYFIGCWPADRSGPEVNKMKFTYLASAVDRILALNQQLPSARRIRVISMSIGWTPDQKGYQEITDAVARAKQAGILVVSSSLDETFGFKFHGLGRSPLANPDDPNSYGPGLFWAPNLGRWAERSVAMLLVPMDSRTTAGPSATDEYVFYRQGGWSWAIPYLAGVYALACQVKPTITPDEFWQTALKTAATIDLDARLLRKQEGLVLDPVALVAALQKGHER